MLSRRLILPEQAEQLKRNWKLIVRFSQSELAARANKAKRIGREIPFSLAKTAKELGLGESEESVIVQGIIDLFFEEEDGLVLVDYKTDRTQEDGTLLPGVMERYSAQLGFYQDALESITGKRVKGKYLYLLRSGREIRVDF